MTESAIQERIWEYVCGNLGEKEAIELWVVLLREPEWIDYLEMLLLLQQQMDRKDGSTGE